MTDQTEDKSFEPIDEAAYVLRRGDTMRFLAMRASAFDEARRAPDFPKPTYLGPCTPAWFKHELIAWLESRRGGAS